MKRAQKLLLGTVVVVAGLTCLWCLLCPVLFPESVKAVNARYQVWIADKVPVKK
jgi:hypothetical protein